MIQIVQEFRETDEGRRERREGEGRGKGGGGKGRGRELPREVVENTRYIVREE